MRLGALVNILFDIEMHGFMKLINEIDEIDQYGELKKTELDPSTLYLVVCALNIDTQRSIYKFMTIDEFSLSIFSKVNEFEFIPTESMIYYNFA